jgi:hypothetical protein
MRALHPPEIVSLVRRIQRLGVELRPDRDRGRILFRPADRLPDELAADVLAAKWQVMVYLEDRGWIGAALDSLPDDDARSDLMDVVLETFAVRTIELNESDEHAAAIALDVAERHLLDRLGGGEA